MVRDLDYSLETYRFYLQTAVYLASPMPLPLLFLSPPVQAIKRLIKKSWRMLENFMKNAVLCHYCLSAVYVARGPTDPVTFDFDFGALRGRILTHRENVPFPTTCTLYYMMVLGEESLILSIDFWLWRPTPM